jgi:hypothetical protein
LLANTYLEEINETLENKLIFEEEKKHDMRNKNTLRNKIVKKIIKINIINLIIGKS